MRAWTVSCIIFLRGILHFAQAPRLAYGPTVCLFFSSLKSEGSVVRGSNSNQQPGIVKAPPGARPYGTATRSKRTNGTTLHKGYDKRKLYLEEQQG